MYCLFMDNSTNRGRRRVNLLILGGLLVILFLVIQYQGISSFDIRNSSLNSPTKVVSEESVTVNAVKQIGPSVVTIVGVNTSSGSQNSFNFGPFFFGTPNNSKQQSQPESIGSGFIVSSSGLIATNKHVVSNTDMKYKVVTSDSKEFDVKQIYKDPNNDVAIIRIDPSQNPGAKLIPANLGDSSNLEAGQYIVAIGTALGQFRNTVTTGVISGLGRGITAGDVYQGSVENLSNVIQISAAVNPGNSGGPLVNSSEQVIGMNTALAVNGQNIGFALPINVVKSFLSTL